MRQPHLPRIRFLSELRRVLPVIKSGVVGTPDGALSASPTAEQSELISRLHCWQYYRMVTQKIN